MSAARDIDRVLFTSFEENGYNIYALEQSETLAGTPIQMPEVATGDTVAPLAALLPPHPTAGGGRIQPGSTAGQRSGSGAPQSRGPG
jgi:hypothetical protein